MTKQEHLESIRQSIENLSEVLFITDTDFLICDMNLQAKRLHPSIQIETRMIDYFPLQDNLSDKLLKTLIEQQSPQKVQVKAKLHSMSVETFHVSLLEVSGSKFYCWKEENIIPQIVKKEKSLYRNMSQILTNSHMALNQMPISDQKKELEYECYFNQYRFKMNDFNCDTYILWMFQQLTMKLQILNIKSLLQLRFDSLIQKADQSVQITLQECNVNHKKSPKYYVRLDELYFHKAIAFILANAYEAVGDEGNVMIRYYIEEENCIIEIEDNGIGILEDEMERVFEPLFTGKEKQDHLGMGLTLAKILIEEQGGSIELYSEYNVGTTVVVKFPLVMKSTGVYEPDPIYGKGFDDSNLEMDLILSQACKFTIPEIERRYQK